MSGADEQHFDKLKHRLDDGFDPSDNLEKIQNLVDEENFRVRDARTKLRSYFEKVLDRVSDHRRRKIIFFIDDLDRCSSDSVLKVLEAIKLYFNLPGCIFFLGIDHDTVEGAVRKADEHSGGSGARYLDKMIQLPFFLPPVAESKFEDYLAGLLPAALQVCLPLMIAGLERNPRSVKRFVNNLILRHRLAATLRISNYDPRLLALLLLFEQIEPTLFRTLARDTDLLTRLRSDRTYAEQQISQVRLVDALFAGYVPQFAPLTVYLSLTNLELATSADEAPSVEIAAVLVEHRLWLRSFHREGTRCVLRGAQLFGSELRRSLLRDAVLETTNLNGAALHGSDMRRAVLAGANLAGADLSEALLNYSDLREADLSGAKLCGADLRDADLARANLHGADLRFAVGLTASQIAESLVDLHTLLPIYLTKPVQRQ